MNRASVQLLAGFGLLGVVLTGLSALNPTRFTSIDSAYYLQSATYWLAGRGYVVPEGSQLSWNSTFPMGYSLLMATVSGLTGLPMLVASKLVNYGAVGLSGWLWIRRLGVSRAGWVLSVWGLGGFLKIMAYTWSETVFLVLLAEWIWCLHRFRSEPDGCRAGAVGWLGFVLFLVRYVGGFALLLVGLIVLVGRLVPSLRSASGLSEKGRNNLLLAVGSGLLGMTVYLGMNYHLSGSMYGGNRLLRTESALDLTMLFVRAIGNELLLIRDSEPGEPSGPAWLGAGLQGVLFLLAYLNVRRKRPDAVLRPGFDPLSRLFMVVGFAYVVVLFSLRVISPFSGPNLRLMAPATFCLLTSGLLWVSTFSRSWQRSVRPFWAGLLLCSWLQLLPQRDMSLKVREFFRKSQSQHSITSRSPVWASMRTKPSCAASLLLPLR